MLWTLIGRQPLMDSNLLLRLYQDSAKILAESLQTQSTATQTTTGEACEHAWRACLAWIMRIVCEKATAGDVPASSLAATRGAPLSQIISTTGSNLVEFFRELPVVLRKLGPYYRQFIGPDTPLESLVQVREWQTSLVLLTVLAKKYKDLFWRFHRLTDAPKQPAMQLGWLLFVYAKSQLLEEFPDLVSCLELLACVVNALAANIPYSAAELELLKASNPMAIGTNFKLSTLKAVSDACKTDISRVQALMPSVDMLLSKVVSDGNAAPSTAAKLHPACPQLDTCCSYHEGLLTNRQQLQAAVFELDRQYEVYHSTIGEIDEREFLTTDFGALASPRTLTHYQAAMDGFPGGPAGRGLGSRQGQDPSGRGNASAMHSPLPLQNLGSAPPSTPVTEAMGAVAWLRSVTVGSATDPPPGLQRYLRSCEVEVEAAIIKRVTDMAHTVLPDSQPRLAMAAAAQQQQQAQQQQPSADEQRRREAVLLYYRVLEAMLRSEERARGTSNFTGLLTANSFHRCLMACCLEVVVATYRMVALSFPAVLERLRLKPFDLSKVLEPFVKSEPSLPRELKRHLFTIEERILESLAWQAGSSLYTVLLSAAGAGGSVSRAQQRPGSAGPAGSADGGDMEDDGAAAPAPAPAAPAAVAASAPQQPTGPGAGISASDSGSGSPVKRSNPYGMASPKKRARCDTDPVGSPRFDTPLPSALGPPLSPTQLAGTPDPAAYSVLQDFFRKVLKLAAFRLVSLTDGMELGTADRAATLQQVYDVVQYAIYHQTHLFYNRHVDQVLLCALYGYCKVNRLSGVSFKDIIAQYRRQPQQRQEVFRSVVLEQSEAGLQVTSTGDIIAFYNRVFVPSMKAFLLHAEARPAGAPAAGTEAAGVATASDGSGGVLGGGADAQSSAGPHITVAMQSQLSAGSRSPMQSGAPPAYRTLFQPGAAGGGFHQILPVTANAGGGDDMLASPQGGAAASPPSMVIAGKPAAQLTHRLSRATGGASAAADGSGLQPQGMSGPFGYSAGPSGPSGDPQAAAAAAAAIGQTWKIGGSGTGFGATFGGNGGGGYGSGGGFMSQMLQPFPGSSMAPPQTAHLQQQQQQQQQGQTGGNVPSGLGLLLQALDNHATQLRGNPAAMQDVPMDVGGGASGGLGHRGAGPFEQQGSPSRPVAMDSS